MKIQNLLAGVLALALTGSAFGQVTVNITGATAFRAAALDTIRARYVASGVAFKYAHDGATFNASTSSIFQGTFNGVASTTIRCTFNGSVEGINALVNSPADDPQYFTDSGAFASLAPTVGGAVLASYAGTKATAKSDAAFSDVGTGVTPFASSGIADNPVGVVVFSFIANAGAPANLTNITSQGWRALLTSGFQDLSLLTGVSTDAGGFVFATGRNDGSGTRTAYLDETGYGVAIPVKQYVVNTSSSTVITQLQLVPAGGVNSPVRPGQLPANRSTIWGQDIDGNGGYSSGSALRTDFGKTSTSVDLRDADYSQIDPAFSLTLVTWLSLNDCVAPKNLATPAQRAKILGYDGVTLSGFATFGATTMTADDLFKVTNGNYAAWSFQQLLKSLTIGGTQSAAIDHIKANIPGNLASAGVPLTSMAVGRTAASLAQSGTIAP